MGPKQVINAIIRLPWVAMTLTTSLPTFMSLITFQCPNFRRTILPTLPYVFIIAWIFVDDWSQLGLLATSDNVMYWSKTHMWCFKIPVSFTHNIPLNCFMIPLTGFLIYLFVFFFPSHFRPQIKHKHSNWKLTNVLTLYPREASLPLILINRYQMKYMLNQDKEDIEIKNDNGGLK